MDLDIDLMRTFATVAETRHFTLAAQQLNRTQSGVSTRIKRLETLLGVKLFHRTRRSVRLTPQGESLRHYANRFLRLNDETLAEFGNPTLSGQVRLCATDTSMCYLPSVLPRFAASYPLVEMEIRCERSWDALSALEAGEVDLALVTQPCERSGGQLVRREPLVWALAKASNVDELDPLPLAMFAPGCIYRQAALDALDECGRSWRHAYSSPSHDGLEVAVTAGMAITVTPASALAPDWRIAHSDRELPPLPEMEVLLFGAEPNSPARVNVLAEIIAQTLAHYPHDSERNTN